MKRNILAALVVAALRRRVDLRKQLPQWGISMRDAVIRLGYAAAGGLLVAGVLAGTGALAAPARSNSEVIICFANQSHDYVGGSFRNLGGSHPTYELFHPNWIAPNGYIIGGGSNQGDC